MDEDLAPSEILAHLQIQAIYRESTGTRLFPFFGLRRSNVVRQRDGDLGLPSHF
jgi:hypothetical protein